MKSHNDVMNENIKNSKIEVQLFNTGKNNEEKTNNYSDGLDAI